MRRILTAAAFSLSLGSAAPAMAEEIVQGSAHWSVAETLIANERTAWDVYARRDTAAPDLLSGDYVEVLDDNTLNDRAAHLAMIADADLSAYALEGFRVIRLSDDAMIVTYEADWTDGAGESGRVAISSGWALRDGEWKNVFYRETPLG
jgi:hypothetical protein